MIVPSLSGARLADGDRRFRMFTEGELDDGP